MKVRVLLSFVVLFSLFNSTLGQTTTPAPTPTPTPQTPKQIPVSKDDDEVVRLNVDLVQVDAVVTDKKGNPVTNLTADDFEIYQDGQQQKISTFAYVTVADNKAEPNKTEKKENKPGLPIPPPPPGNLNPEKVRRTIALVVDDLGLSHESSYYVRKALRKFVDEEMQEGDLVAIIRTGAGLGALQQFTADKRMLHAAIERVKFNLNSRSNIFTFSPVRNDSMPSKNAKSATADELDKERDRADPMNPGGERLGEDLDEFREEVFAVGTLGAVNYVVRGMRELPGRKAVILFSDGFKIYSQDPGATIVADSLQRLIDLANRSSVVFYTIDPRGLQTFTMTAADDLTGPPAAPYNANNPINFGDQTYLDFLGKINSGITARGKEFFETQQGLNYLAQETGGFMVKNNNDIDGAVRRVLVDQKSYYIIGYQPGEGTFKNERKKSFHKLSVKVKGENFRVRSRTGFFSVPTDNSLITRRTGTEQLYAALTSPFGKNDVELRMNSMFGYDFKKGSFAQSLVHINAKDLTFTPINKDDPNTAYKTNISIMAVTFGDNGQVMDQDNKYYTFEVSSADLKRNVEAGLLYTVTLPIKKPGAYQLRLAVMDAATLKVGSASQYIEIPDVKKGGITLSGMTVIPASEQPFIQQIANKTDQLSDFRRKTNLAERKFMRGMSLEYAYFIYNAKTDNTGRPQIETLMRLFCDGKEIFTGQRRPLDLTGQADLKQIVGRGALRLGTELKPGDYVLQIIVFDKLAKEKKQIASQSIDFEINE